MGGKGRGGEGGREGMNEWNGREGKGKEGKEGWVGDMIMRAMCMVVVGEHIVLLACCVYIQLP